MRNTAGKSRAPWWAHFMSYAGGLIMVVAGATAGVAQFASTTAENAVPTEDILGDAQAEMDVEDIQGPLNILVLGTDKQGGSTRSDTMIIVHLNADLTKATMVSLPRDLLVEIPDCGPDYDSPCQNKLNHAASISDDWAVTRENVVQTVHNLTGLKFELGATADFNGFVEMVELVGTIEICVWKEFQSYHTERVFEKGCSDYDEEAALDLVRQRYDFYDPIDYDLGLYGDYARQNFQQQAIKSLLKELKADGYLEDPTKIPGLLEGFGDKVTIAKPDDLSIVDLAVNFRDIDPEAMTTVRVPASSVDESDWGSIELIHEGAETEAASSLWEALQTDTMDAWIAANPQWVKSSDPMAEQTEAPTDAASSGETTD